MTEYTTLYLSGLIGAAIGWFLLWQFRRQKQAEDIYRNLFDNANDAIFIYDLTGRLLKVNKTACTRLGYSSEELLQMTPKDMDSPEYAEKVSARMAEILREGHLVFETAHIAKNGRCIPIEMSSSVIKYQGQKAVLCYARDISKRKKTEQALRISDEKFSKAFYSNPSPMAIIDLESGQFIEVNESLLQTLGYEKDEILFKTALELCVFHDISQRDAAIKIISETGCLKNYEIVCRSKTGELRYGLFSADTIRLQDQKLLLTAMSDITKFKKAEDKLRKIYKILNETQAISKVGGWEYDAVTGKLEWTDEVYRIYGVSRDYDPNVKQAIRFYDAESARIMEQAFENALEAGEPYDLELGFVRAGGEHIWVRTIGTPIIEKGRVVRVIGNFMDITERKKIESKLHFALRYNRSLIEASIDPLVTIDPEGKISDVNAATEQITGYSRTELIGTDFSDYFTEPEKARIGYRQVFEKRVVRDYFLEIRHRNGHVTPVIYNASVYSDEHENVIGVFAAARDITERIRAEEQIRASLAEKEVLLREIHHRVKNNMQVITSLLRLQSKQIIDPQILELFRESHTRISAMALIHETLYQSPELARIDFKNYLDKLVRTLFQIYGARIGRIRLSVDIGDISLDMDQAIPLGLIINELVSNSLKYAFPNKKSGEIGIAIRQDKDRIELCVSDNGIGIAPESDIRNMDSLGLRLVFDLVERQLQGSVEVVRTEGTRFIITFRKHE